MRLSQLLITLDSFQRVLLAGATSLKRDWIWFRAMWEVLRLAGWVVCADPRGSRSPAQLLFLSGRRVLLGDSLERRQWGGHS